MRKGRRCYHSANFKLQHFNRIVHALALLEEGLFLNRFGIVLLGSSADFFGNDIQVFTNDLRAPISSGLLVRRRVESLPLFFGMGNTHWRWGTFLSTWLTKSSLKATARF